MINPRHPLRMPTLMLS
jgi:hypothetical protein